LYVSLNLQQRSRRVVETTGGILVGKLLDLLCKFPIPQAIA
jgi:hypothetical protein